MSPQTDHQSSDPVQKLSHPRPSRYPPYTGASTTVLLQNHTVQSARDSVALVNTEAIRIAATITERNFQETILLASLGAHAFRCKVVEGFNRPLPENMQISVRLPVFRVHRTIPGESKCVPA